MSFKSLEQRFNENVNTLYAAATTKFENGKSSLGTSDDPIIVRKPSAGYWGAMESRSTPIRSAAQDLKRLTLFQLSPDGLKFLAKQQLLQTGNTFEFTRALNPAFIVGNAVPFLHIKRNLRPLNELVGKTDTSYANVKSMGQLQVSTYNKLKSITSAHPFSTATGFSRPGAGSALKSRLLAPLNALKDTVTGAISAFNPNQKRNIGELGADKWGPQSWTGSRPELVNYVDSIQSTQRKFQSNRDKLFVKYFDTPRDENGGGIGSLNDAKTGARNSSGVTTEPDSFGHARWERLTHIEYGGSRTSRQKISYIKDPSNKVIPEFTTAYSPIPTAFDDPIKVSFAMGKEDPIQFRAFIKDLVENSNPQHQSFQYIGRIEKFINYTGVQRDISFKLAVLAFSKDELETVWRRINYLTGLTFPYGFTRGIMQPNIVRLTIGNVYNDQPGYITALSTNFNEPAGSWDIDEGVPIGAAIDMKFTLIEKASRIASSPFYGITENTQGFDLNLNVPARLNALDARKSPPTVQSITTKVESRAPAPVPEFVSPFVVNVPTVNIPIP